MLTPSRQSNQVLIRNIRLYALDNNLDAIEKVRLVELLDEAERRFTNMPNPSYADQTFKDIEESRINKVRRAWGLPPR